MIYPLPEEGVVAVGVNGWSSGVGGRIAASTGLGVMINLACPVDGGSVVLVGVVPCCGLTMSVDRLRGSNLIKNRFIDKSLLSEHKQLIKRRILIMFFML